MSLLARAASAAVRTASRLPGARAFSSAAGRRRETAQSATLLDIGARPIFDETHDQFREVTRKFYAEQVVPHHAKWEEEVGTNV
jgi:hypothetical protein